MIAQERLKFQMLGIKLAFTQAVAPTLVKWVGAATSAPSVMRSLPSSSLIILILPIESYPMLIDPPSQTGRLACALEPPLDCVQPARNKTL